MIVIQKNVPQIVDHFFIELHYANLTKMEVKK